MIFADYSSFENTKPTNYSTNELESLFVNRFSANLVHRHTSFMLTLLLLENMMIISPHNTLYIMMQVSKQ